MIAVEKGGQMVMLKMHKNGVKNSIKIIIGVNGKIFEKYCNFDDFGV